MTQSESSINTSNFDSFSDFYGFQNFLFHSDYLTDMADKVTHKVELKILVRTLFLLIIGVQSHPMPIYPFF